jgi:hypothetical protein
MTEFVTDIAPIKGAQIKGDGNFRGILQNFFVALPKAIYLGLAVILATQNMMCKVCYEFTSIDIHVPRPYSGLRS